MAAPPEQSTIPEEELLGALMELTDASHEAQHGNDQDIWAIGDRYDDVIQRARMLLVRVSRVG